MSDAPIPPTSGEPIGPQQAARAVLEVEAEPVPGTGPDAPPQPEPERTLSPADEWRATLTLSIGLSTGILARKWRAFETSKDEVETVVDAWVPVCVKYWPSGIPIEFVAIFATLSTFGPKVLGAIKEEKSNRQARDAAKRDSEANATRAEPGTHVAS